MPGWLCRSAVSSFSFGAQSCPPAGLQASLPPGRRRAAGASTLVTAHALTAPRSPSEHAGVGLHLVEMQATLLAVQDGLLCPLSKQQLHFVLPIMLQEQQQRDVH